MAGPSTPVGGSDVAGAAAREYLEGFSLIGEDHMAKNGTKVSKGGNGAATENGATPESLDQVRDILFGGQMRVVDARLRGLEERLLEEQASLRADFGRQVAELDDSIKKGLAAQAEKLAGERAKRIEDVKALGSELKEALKAVDRRHLKLEEVTGQADAELRDQLLKQSAALSAELARVADRFAADLERRASALQDQKLDTAALATALTDMAGRLTGNGRAPGKGAQRG